MFNILTYVLVHTIYNGHQGTADFIASVIICIMIANIKGFPKLSSEIAWL